MRNVVGVTSSCCCWNRWYGSDVAGVTGSPCCWNRSATTGHSCASSTVPYEAMTSCTVLGLSFDSGLSPISVWTTKGCSVVSTDFSFVKGDSKGNGKGDPAVTRTGDSCGSAVRGVSRLGGSFSSQGNSSREERQSCRGENRFFFTGGFLGGSSASDDALSSALSNSQYEVFRVARRVRDILTQLLEQPQENKNEKEKES